MRNKISITGSKLPESPSEETADSAAAHRPLPRKTATMSSSTLDTTAITDALNDVGRRFSEAALSATSFPETKKLFEAPPVKKILDADNGAKLTEELLDALLVTNKGTLTRLDDTAFAAGCRVIVRADYERQVKNARYVSVISGGGSGHEPAHAGFVGAGLLTAAVCGDVFASPSAKAVLAAIVATSSQGPAVY